MTTTKIKYNQIKTGLPAGDVNYSNVTLLLNMEGSDGSTTFTDGSNTNRAISKGSSAEISVNQFKFGSSSLYLPGNSNSYLYTNGSNLGNFGSDDFTIEIWSYITSGTFAGTSISKFDSLYGNNNRSWILGPGVTSGQNRFAFNAFNSSQSTIVSLLASGYNTNQWYHVAVTREGNTFRLFVDGNMIDSASSSQSLESNSVPVTIGSRYNNGSYSQDPMTGYLDGVRITEGVARYTSNFSVPTAAFPALQSNQGKKMVVGSNGYIDLQ